MATLQIEDLPEELYSYIQSLALENNLTINEAAIYLLKQSLESEKVKSNPEKENKKTSETLQKIRNRHRVNPMDFGLKDSTILIREDRQR